MKIREYQQQHFVKWYRKLFTDLVPLMHL